LNVATGLVQVFQVGVLDQLQNIINEPTTPTWSNQVVDTINDIRCLRILPDVDIM
jgi:hypothetical protein